MADDWKTRLRQSKAKYEAETKAQEEAKKLAVEYCSKKGLEDGEIWARNTASYRELSGYCSGEASHDPSLDGLRYSNVLSEPNPRAIPEALIKSSYQKGFLDGATKALREVDEDESQAPAAPIW